MWGDRSSFNKLMFNSRDAEMTTKQIGLGSGAQEKDQEQVQTWEMQYKGGSRPRSEHNSLGKMSRSRGRQGRTDSGRHRISRAGKRTPSKGECASLLELRYGFKIPHL